MDNHLTKVQKYNELKSYYDGDDPQLSRLINKLKNLGLDIPIDIKPVLEITSGLAKKAVDTYAARLWSNPIQVRNVDLATVLGSAFLQTGKRAQTWAGICGVAHWFYDNGNVQLFRPLEYFPLPDELTGEDRAGIRFWRVSDDKPWNVQLFERSGYTWYIRGVEKGKDNELTIHQEKRPYRRVITPRAAGDEYATVETNNYPEFPIIPLYGNDDRQTDLNNAGLSKVKAMNLKETLYSNEVFRNPLMAWYIQGYGGNPKTLVEMKKMMQVLGVFPTEATKEEDGATINPVSFEIPYAEHETSMNRYRAGIARDWTFLDQETVSGGSLTNVVIKAHMQDIDIKAGDKEKLAADALRKLLYVAGYDVDIADITFSHSTLVNDLEYTQRIVQLVQNGVITPEIAVHLEPLLINSGRVEEALNALAAQQSAMDEAAIAEFERQKAELAMQAESSDKQ